MSIFISTGELSGDLYAAKLSSALAEVLPDDELWGMCGPLAQGVRREWSNDQLHILGLGRILKSLPALFALRNQLAEAVAERKPRAVIVVDSPDFHIPLLRKIRALGYRGPVVYVCPPTIWAWRSGRAKYLKQYCDLCLPLFQFEEKALEEHQVRSFWCGNPLIEDFEGYQPADTSLCYDPMRIAMLPGSRRSEIRTLLPVLEEAALKLSAKGLKPVFSVAPGLDEVSKQMILNNRSGIATTQISGRDLMFSSRMVVGASGTAAVESMMLDRFMVVLYKGTALEWRIYNMLTHTKYVSIPNVLAGTMLFPELLQEKATANNVTDAVARYFEDAAYRHGIHEQIALNKDMMGTPGAVRRWAEAIADLVKK